MVVIESLEHEKAISYGAYLKTDGSKAMTGDLEFPISKGVIYNDTLVVRNATYGLSVMTLDQSTWKDLRILNARPVHIEFFGTNTSRIRTRNSSAAGIYFQSYVAAYDTDALLKNGELIIYHAGDITFLDGKNIIVDTTTGTKIATGATQKLGFFGVTPVVQQSHIVDADGTLADVTTKFNSLLSKLEALGLLASS